MSHKRLFCFRVELRYSKPAGGALCASGYLAAKTRGKPTGHEPLTEATLTQSDTEALAPIFRLFQLSGPGQLSDALLLLRRVAPPSETIERGTAAAMASKSRRGR